MKKPSEPVLHAFLVGVLCALMVTIGIVIGRTTAENEAMVTTIRQLCQPK